MKETIVFLPGFLCDERIWQFQKDTLSKDYNAIIINLKETPDLKAMLESINAVTSESFHLVGFSMGGFIAQNFASLYKERIKSLTLVASDGGALSEREKTARLNMEALLKKSRYKGIGHKELPRFLSEQSLKDPSIGELIISMSQGFTSEMYINQMKATIDRKDEARAIDQENYPVLIIGAKDDQVVSYKNIEELHRKISRSKLETITNSGHYIPLERPTLLTDILSQFFKSSSGQTAR